MNKLIPPFLLALLLTLFLVSAATASKKKAQAKIRIDSSKVEVKKFDASAIKRYGEDKDFNYNGQATGQPSLWERFWHWLWNKILGLFDRIPYAGSIFKYLLLGLAIALLIYVIAKSLGIDPTQLLRRDAKRVDILYSESLENINEINFDAEIENAISQHNFRLAVRLSYLKCLKQLADRGLIQWQIDKTNTAYLHELTDPVQKQSFGLLTRQFEYVWYGDFFIDKDIFSNINLLFQNFKNHLP